MSKIAKKIPAGYHSLTPYLSVNGASAAIEFYKRAFAATEVGRITMPDGLIAHAEIKIGDSIIMLSDENIQWGNTSPRTLGGTAVYLCLYVEDVDSVYAQAIKSGAKVLEGMEVKDQFYGDRTGSLLDPFGHKWTIMTHIKDVSYGELQEQTNAMFSTNN